MKNIRPDNYFVKEYSPNRTFVEFLNSNPAYSGIEPKLLFPEKPVEHHQVDYRDEAYEPRGFMGQPEYFQPTIIEHIPTTPLPNFHDQGFRGIGMSNIGHLSPEDEINMAIDAVKNDDGGYLDPFDDDPFTYGDPFVGSLDNVVQDFDDFAELSPEDDPVENPY
jgi:hypothetical protein